MIYEDFSSTPELPMFLSQQRFGRGITGHISYSKEKVILVTISKYPQFSLKRVLLVKHLNVIDSYQEGRKLVPNLSFLRHLNFSIQERKKRKER